MSSVAVTDTMPVRRGPGLTLGADTRILDSLDGQAECGDSR